MRRMLLGLVCLGAALSLAAPGVYACGDKFLVVGRGVRYARSNAPVQTASILIYKNADTVGVPPSAIDIELQSTLKQAGHRFQVVAGLEELTRALQGGQFDIVLADLADASAVEENLRTAINRPAVLPVVYNPQERADAA